MFGLGLADPAGSLLLNLELGSVLLNLELGLLLNLELGSFLLNLELDGPLWPRDVASL